MNTKSNKIKVFAKVGLMKGEKWLKGIVLEEYENIFLVETHGNKITVNKRLVKPVYEVIYDDYGRCAELDSFVEQNWEDLKEKISNSVKSFFPDIKININEEDKIIECEQFGISVCGSIKEVEAISCFKEIPVWELISFVTIPATRHKPEDVCENLVASDSNSVFIAKSFLDHIWKLKSNCYWENENVSYSS